MIIKVEDIDCGENCNQVDDDAHRDISQIPERDMGFRNGFPDIRISDNRCSIYSRRYLVNNDTDCFSQNTACNPANKKNNKRTNEGQEALPLHFVKH